MLEYHNKTRKIKTAAIKKCPCALIRERGEMLMYFICLTSTTECSVKQDQNLIEEQLLRIAKKDKEALSYVYNQTKTSVYGFALSILKNPYDAEDVLQETYITIYSAADKYEPQGKPLAWIFTIAKNLCFMKLREGKKMAEWSEEKFEKIEAYQPEVTIEDKIVLRAAMEQLTCEEGQIIMLHAVAGFKFREISAMLTLPLATVLSKYHRSIKKLKISMEQGSKKDN